MKKTIIALAITSALSLEVAQAGPILRITEVMSSSGVSGTADWFEITNVGDATANISGYKMDDSTFSFASSVSLQGVSAIDAGESVIFLEVSDPSFSSTLISDFRTFWGLAATPDIGYYSGSGIGFSSNFDGLVIFDDQGNEVTPQTSFGAATSGTSFYWSYDATGGFVNGSASSGVLSTQGTSGAQVTFLSTSTSPQNLGSPGTAILASQQNPQQAVPEPPLFALCGLGVMISALVRKRRITAH